MNRILPQVARARRKLQVELLLQRLLRCWSIGLVIGVMVVGLPKLIPMGPLPIGWTTWCVLGLLALSSLVALVWTGWQGYDDMATAIEIDRRYHLRERVASSLSLGTQAVTTPAGQALIADARRALKQVNVTERFPVRLGQRAWFPLIPAVLVFALTTLVDDRPAQSRPDLKNSQVSQKQLDETTHLLRKRLAEKRKQATKAGLKDAEAFLRNLEKEAEKLATTHAVARKKTLVKLNDLASQIDQRQQQLGNRQALRKQFAQMKNLGHGPADKMVDAMKQGQWSTASRELGKIRKQITSAKLSPQARKQLAKQLQQMQKKLQSAAAARQQAIEDLTRELDHLNKKTDRPRPQGNLSRTAQLQQQLDKLLQQQNQTNRLQQLAQPFGQLSQSLSQGNQAGIESALQQMENQFAQFEQQQAESELLDAAQGQFQLAKDNLIGQECSQCQGAGCQVCQGGNRGSVLGKPGHGLKPGKAGFGPRPDEKNEVKFRASRVPQKPGRGAAVIVGEVDGPNRRGQVTEAIQKEMATQGSTPADPLVMEQLPRSHREHAQQYFNLLREGR